MEKLLAVLILLMTLPSCSETNQNNNEKHKALQIENDSLKAMLDNAASNEKLPIATFLTFQDNNSENAMNFYLSIFENSKIIKVQRWEKGGPGKEGTIMHSIFDLIGNLFMCSDSPPIHDWGFTPAVSNYIDCTSENELKDLYNKLSVNGKELMPLGDYGFSRMFGFIEDQFGISWQLNLK